jgi:hypothetical protein
MFQIRFQQLVTSVSSLLCHSSTCLRIGSKLRCIRSTQSMSENDFECLASTGVNMTWTMFPNSGPVTIGLPRSRLSTKTCGPPDSLVFNFRIDRYTSVGRQGIRDCGREGIPYCNFKYSVFDCRRIGTSESASFQRAKKSL